jgi:hypothetical protein
VFSAVTARAYGRPIKNRTITITSTTSTIPLEVVALTASVRPSRQQHAGKNQDQDNQQNGVNANDLLPVFTASASRARTRVHQSEYTGGRVCDKTIGGPEGRLFAGAHGTVCQ